MTLASYAASDGTSRGRVYSEPKPAHRSEYQRDRDRIIHCAAFRRLEYKTQVFVNHEGDLFRTRLTHSIEVAQIARSIARSLRLNEDLTEAIALAHDLGHTPFGHAGQDALNECMRGHGGFEHNLQSLRVVDTLEERYADFAGLNLTYETREGILKHCPVAKAREMGELGARFLRKTQPTLEAQLVNLADEIAYNNHDVDDGLRSGLISIEQLSEVALFEEYRRDVQRLYPALTGRRVIHETIRRMIGGLVNDVIAETTRRLEAGQIRSLGDVRAQTESTVGYSTEVREKSLTLKRFLRNNLYSHQQVERITRESVKAVHDLFAAFYENPALLPTQYREKLVAEGPDPATTRARTIADYIAGMTDRYALKEHERVCRGQS